MTDITQRLRESAKAARALDRAALLEEAAGEIEKLRLQPCPYVTGSTTRYCTLTPLTLTQDERTAIVFIAHNDPKDGFVRRTWLTFKTSLCGLLERTK